MSSSGDDQIKSSQIFNPHIQEHSTDREAVLGEWQPYHRTLICTFELAILYMGIIGFVVLDMEVLGSLILT
ncbi:hypothetical protein E2C01_042549 [Portunus trituberculatus]|uniref:Uncharacterized protein n=1 Tax=Portunus trituberculatus TaxID=210409 RepID=A0A5B7FTS1_PORTR|nr:hypothetical protein [Portunus trituberculatus]